MLSPEPQAGQPVAEPSLLPLSIPQSPEKAAFVERRSERRNDLNVVVFVVPMNGEFPDISKAFTAVTKDISNKGIGVIANRSILTPELLICLWGEREMRLVRATVRHRKDLGLGWVRFGVEVTGTVEKGEYPQLRRFVESLLS